MKNILLFIIVCGVASVCILLGSVLGHGVSNRGVFVGAIIGGILGVSVATWLASRFGLLEKARYDAVFLGGIIGFIVAAIIAVSNLRGPIIPIASVSLIGIGAVLGKRLSGRRAA
jgi:hypothetical protein